jgi:hypothetical protein
MLREVGAMDQLEQLIDRIPMNGYGQPGRDGKPPARDVMRPSSQRTLIPCRWVFSFFSLTLDFIYMNEIRT